VALRFGEEGDPFGGGRELNALWPGKRAALIRAWPPWLSRLSISVLSRTAANCS
jgi:hypothetical protein